MTKKLLIISGGMVLLIVVFSIWRFVNSKPMEPVDWQISETKQIPKIIFFQPGIDSLEALMKAGFDKDFVSALSTDLAKANFVMNWSHGLWSHNGDNDPGTTNPKTILEKAQAGDKFRCVEYSVMTVAAARSVGLNARVVGLRTREIETADYGAGHVVAEIYLTDLKKWIMVDAQWSLIPIIDGTPVHAAELAASLGKKNIQFMNSKGEIISDASYLSWISPYLYYIAFRIDQRLNVNPRSQDQLILIPKGAKIPEKFQNKPISGIVFPVFAPTSVYTL